MLVKDGPTMTIAPFLMLRLRGKKDALLARQRARRVASLLSFDCQEQACIAAATFVVACQALTVFGKARLCFQIENHQLQIFAEAIRATPDSQLPTPAKRLEGLFPEGVSATLFRLAKQLPAQQASADEVELGWLVTKLEETAGTGIFDEIVKQNQEILALLHELRLFREDSINRQEKSPPPHAA